MDSSPETNKLPVSSSSSSSSHSPAVQESPFFNYLRTLSPIKPVKAAAHVSQVFPELSIPPPPPVFTSPRLNPQSETFLNRSKYSDSPNATLSTEHEDEGHTLATGSDVSKRSTSRLMIGLVSCSKNACKTRGSPQIEPCSPRGLVDEYLADPIEVDGIVTSSDPADPHFNQTENTPKASLNGGFRSKESTSKVEADNDNTMQYMEIGSDVQITSSDQTKEGLQGKSLSFLESGKMKIGEGKSLETPDVRSEKIGDVGLSESSLKPSLGEQKAPHVDTQSAEGVRDGRGDTYTQELPGFLQIDELAEGSSHESVENKAVDLEETGQQQRGTRRRCLQFESSATHTKFITSNRAYLNSASISHCLSVPAISTNLEMLDSSQMDVVTSSNSCTVSSSQPMPCKSSLCSAYTGETHVHNVDRSVRNGGNSSRKIPVPSGIGLHLNSIVNTAAMGSTKPSIIRPEEPRSSSSPSTVIGNVSAKSGGKQQEPQLIVAEGSLASQIYWDNADRFQEFNQQSPRYKRKRTDSEDEGCKRCNCKRSKCLKLYCECFAAGIYCAEPCACHECFNRPGYEDMVLETRRQIQSRNPLAFVPKIVTRITDSPANSGEENNKVTPASARHKRGCNCKKSMCLKKYCECFQSGVGCSVGCRCDGCRNTFGVKEGYGQFSGMARKVDGEIWEDQSDGRVVMETRNKLLLSEHRHSHNLTPPTPSFQCSVHKKDMPKSRFPGRRYLPSPESPSSPRNMNAYERQAKMADGNLDIVFDQDMEFSTSGRMDQFSPKWDRFDDICNLTPLSQASSKASRVQLQGSIRLSGSLRWRSSPVTPMPRLGESKVCQEPDSDVASDMLEDETPDILKDTHTPVKTVKVSSPNQKRITPPHNHLHNLRSSPSPGLKSGRKFVLQSISSFPPLTPYSDPKGSSADK